MTLCCLWMETAFISESAEGSLATESSLLKRGVKKMRSVGGVSNRAYY